MAIEATKMAVRSNVHMNTRVVEVIELNSEVRCDPRPFGGRYSLKSHQNGR